MRRAFLGLALMSCGAGLAAQEGFPLLKLAPGARTAALAGAQGMVAGRAESLWANPAAAAGARGLELSAGHMAWIADTQLSSGALLLGSGPIGFGLYGQYAGAQDMRRGALGQELGVFGLNSTALGGALGLRVSQVDLGAAFKLLSQSVDASAVSALAADAGAILHLWNGHVAVSAAALNLGSAQDDGDGAWPLKLPTAFRGGLGLLDLNGFSVFQEYAYWPASATGTYSAGLQAEANSEAARLAFRLEWQAQADGGQGAGLALGLGFGSGPWDLSYAYQGVGDLGAGHRVTMDLRFAGAIPPVKEKLQDAPPKQATPAELEQRVREHNRAGTRFYKAGMHAMALEQYRMAEQLDPANAKTHYNLGGVQWALGRREQAVEHFHRSLRLDPDQTMLREWMLDQGLELP